MSAADRLLSEALRECGLSSAAWVVGAGVHGAEAVAAIRRDIDHDPRRRTPTFRALLALLGCYERREDDRVARAIEAWDRAGCASCALHIASVDAAATGCAGCAGVSL